MFISKIKKIVIQSKYTNLYATTKFNSQLVDEKTNASDRIVHEISV
jgi:hypothetical protein